MRQLGLNIQLKDWAVFDSFVTGSNQAAVHYLSALSQQQDSVAWIWGQTGVGKTHLLQAACASLQNSVFIPCRGWQEQGLNAALLADLSALDLVCVDDVHELGGSREWEEALLLLFNDLQDSGGKLVVSTRLPPTEVTFAIPDVASRLRWGPVFRLKPLTDEQVGRALKLRAVQRGLVLPEDTLAYLMRHHSRDQQQLFALLNRLDLASLAAQRRLTIPFVKSVLNPE